MDFASFYDEQPDYAEFRNNPEQRRQYSVIVDWKVRNLSSLVHEDTQIASILEVGCAFGILLNKIGDKLGIADRSGIDIAAGNINVAEKMFPDCNFFKGTLEDFISVHPEKKFDLVVLSDIVEHVPDDAGFLNQAARMGKYVLLNLPLEKSFTTRNRKYGEQDPSGHLRSYNEQDASFLVKKSGFRIINSFTDVAFFDKAYREIYKSRRSARVRKKPLSRRIFWTIFYFKMDLFWLINKKLTSRIIGENYFALLESPGWD